MLIGQMVNLLRDGAPLRMCKRAGTVVTLDDLVEAIGVDAARYALARYSLRHQPSTSTSTCGPGRPATTRSSTCSTPTPGSASILRNAADLGLDSADRRLRPRRCSTHEKEGELLRALAEFPRVVAARRRAARAAPGRALPRGHRRRRTTGSTTPAGCCRWATRSRPTCTGPGCCWSPPPARSSANGLAPARRLRPGADVSAMRAHEAGWAHADPARRGPGLAAPARRPQRARRRTCGRRPRTRRRRRADASAAWR